MSAPPLVSIVIPTYDRPELLGHALASVLAQSHEHLDVFIADDGTNPDTEAVVRDLAHGDPRVRYARNERNLGAYRNGLQVLRAARGEYVKVLLDDDLLAPGHVERLLEPLLDDPTLTLAFSSRRIIDANGVEQPTLPGYEPLAPHAVRIDGGALINLCASRLMNLVGEHSAALWPRACFDMRAPFRFAGGIPTGVLSDLAMWFTLLGRGDAWYEPEPLTAFRRHAGQVSEAPSVHLEALTDWAMLQERLHLVTQPPDAATRIATMSHLVGVLAGNLAQTPDLPEAAAARVALTRSTKHLDALRSTGRIADAPRATIVVVAEGDAPMLLAQLEAIIDATPQDAFEAVIAYVDVTEPVRSLLASLDGDVQIVEAPDRAAAWSSAAAQARHAHVVHLTEEALPRRGWLAALFDGLGPVEDGSAVTAVTSSDGGRALLMTSTSDQPLERVADPWQSVALAHAQTSCRVDAAAGGEVGADAAAGSTPT